MLLFYLRDTGGANVFRHTIGSMHNHVDAKLYTFAYYLRQINEKKTKNSKHLTKVLRNKTVWQQAFHT